MEQDQEAQKIKPIVMANAKVAYEVAEQDFMRMCQANRIETDAGVQGEVSARIFASRKRTIICEIMRGNMIVNDDGTPVYTPPEKGAKAITFYPATGAVFMVADGHDGNNHAAAAMLQEITRTTPGEMARLKAPDFQFCSEVLHLFLNR